MIFFLYPCSRSDETATLSELLLSISALCNKMVKCLGNFQECGF